MIGGPGGRGSASSANALYRYLPVSRSNAVLILWAAVITVALAILVGWLIWG
jgi:hypothetical protein